MIRAGIIGGDGYTTGELVRLLLNHPDVDISWVVDAQNVGSRVADVHQGILGDTDLVITDAPRWDNVDVLFLALPHGASRRFLAANAVPEGLKIIDLTKDHRMEAEGNDFVYGLPELNRKPMVRGAKHVANPGSFAMAIELSLLPLAKNLLINSPVHITAITGSIDDEQSDDAESRFSWRNNNVSVFEPLTHRHLGEIRQTLESLQSSFKQTIDFIPMRGSWARGLLAVTYLDTPVELSELKALYEDYYDDHNFTFLSSHPVSLKDVVNTNKCLIHLDKVGDTLIITTVIDNLLKGASGTAVHNMNLLFGLHEKTGLYLKASSF